MPLGCLHWSSRAAFNRRRRHLLLVLHGGGMEEETDLAKPFQISSLRPRGETMRRASRFLRAVEVADEEAVEDPCFVCLVAGLPRRIPASGEVGVVP